VKTEKSQHIHVVDVVKKVQQRAYVAMNSVSQPARIAKRERERRQLKLIQCSAYQAMLMRCKNARQDKEK